MTIEEVLYKRLLKAWKRYQLSRAQEDLVEYYLLYSIVREARKELDYIAWKLENERYF